MHRHPEGDKCKDGNEASLGFKAVQGGRWASSTNGDLEENLEPISSGRRGTRVRLRVCTHPGLRGARGLPAPLRLPGRPGRGREIRAQKPAARPAAHEPGGPRSLSANHPAPGRPKTAGPELPQRSARRQHPRSWARRHSRLAPARGGPRLPAPGPPWPPWPEVPRRRSSPPLAGDAALGACSAPALCPPGPL